MEKDKKEVKKIMDKMWDELNTTYLKQSNIKALTICYKELEDYIEQVRFQVIDDVTRDANEI